MKYLNLGCGGDRHAAQWINVDTLREQLVIGTPERENLDAESNYVEHNLLEPLPWPDESIDGILAQHLIEHLDCWQAVRLLAECRRVLIPGGVVVVSVPDAEYFLAHLHEDTRENAVKLFGEPISEPEHETFFSYALLHRDHKQILTYASLKCLLIAAGFEAPDIHSTMPETAETKLIYDKLNRRKFSAVMSGVKPASPE